MTQDSSSMLVVMPCFDDRAACSQLIEELDRNFGRSVRVVVVDDGSPNQPFSADLLDDLGVCGSVIRLKRNVGHQVAIAVGLWFAESVGSVSKGVVVMDSDGEDRPESISCLLTSLEQSGVDAAVAQRGVRVESFRFKAFYWAYTKIFWLLAGRNLRFGNFMVLTPAAVSRLVAMKELPVHVAGAVLASKLRTTRPILDRGARYAGESKMNFIGLALHGFRGLMVFAEDVLVRVGVACTLVASMALVGMLTAIFLKALGYSTPGWFSIALGVLLVIFLQTAALTLVSLMIAGNLRSQISLPHDFYSELVQDISESNPLHGGSTSPKVNFAGPDVKD